MNPIQSHLFQIGRRCGGMHANSGRKRPNPMIIFLAQLQWTREAFRFSDCLFRIKIKAYLLTSLLISSLCLLAKHFIRLYAC